MKPRNLPPSTCRHCRIGHHQGCTAPSTCACRVCHLPDLLDIDQGGDDWPDRPDAAADLEEALACLYALEERAHRTLTQGGSRVDALRQALADIRAIARACVAGIDGD